jgi:hypothetical protein
MNRERVLFRYGPLSSPHKQHKPAGINIRELEKEYENWLKLSKSPSHRRFKSPNKKASSVLINSTHPIKKQNALKLLNSRRNNMKHNEYENLKTQVNSKLNLKRVPGLPVKVYKYSALNKGKLIGFAVVQNRFSNNTRNLHLIVAQRGVGRKIFNKIIENAIQNKRSNIALQAVKSAVPAYIKWGFKNRGNAGNYQLMTYSLPRPRNR